MKKIKEWLKFKKKNFNKLIDNWLIDDYYLNPHYDYNRGEMKE